MKNWSVIAASVVVVFGCLPPVALAQEAEIPNPNKTGDFTTAQLQGNRGNTYNNTRWLVVDPNPQYLNCRNEPNANAKVVARLAPGTVIAAVFPDNGKSDAIVMNSGLSWLRVQGVANRKFSTCYVRANLKYVAPISEDYLRQVQ